LWLVPFEAIFGQAAAVGTLEQMLRAGRVHHALRFEGIEGVGKEMAAMAFAQALVCTAGNPTGCGGCSACERAVTMGEGVPSVPLHPDVIFVERGLYPPEVLGRTRPEAQELSVDQIRTVVLERAAFPPHEGKARIYIVRRAEELSISAANALLKTLEEPGRNTYFVLLVSRPARLLSTIRSRTLRVRFAPLGDDVLRKILASHGISSEEVERVIPLCAGSATAALELADAHASEQREAFVRQALEALQSKDSAAALAFADSQGRDKAVVRLHLGALAVHFARQAREAVLRQELSARQFALRHELVLQAISDVERNASPVLAIENMMLRLRAETG
jgi:DNA polymerase-3 subunit delta'